ncbi:CHY zinc finger protein [Jeotgalibacillus proteolyticus]|uniref:CHY-type domain-containing protein n=1 Tax=Jeotgalibacillus proteolyticus TaxID=2082395 RepID=A0A2S5GC76_9BACL|nr:CHY zinc finger protein [Jeotgalibacillus proteolyticus]PPA70632.1 hypothetical protein C4B60_07475 [Jeotgalibacillus proteolyticus]
MNIHGHKVAGELVDRETRCKHYYSKKDIIAIKFFCCQTYFPCFSCHRSSGCQNHAVWPKDRFDEKAVLCGSCGTELSIRDYLACHSQCPECAAYFNPGCSLHAHYYFEMT